MLFRLMTVIAAGSPGDATITAVPGANTVVPAWRTGYTPPVRFPKPVTLATSLVTVVGAKAVPSINIVGHRSMVKGRSIIEIEGTAINMDDSVALTPWLKLAGQPDYRAGSAVLRPGADGTFSWARRTARTAYVYVATTDGSVTSNRVTIR